jgi:hypothetical protein
MVRAMLAEIIGELALSEGELALTMCDDCGERDSALWSHE